MIVSTPVTELSSEKNENNDHIFPETSKNEKISQSEMTANKNGFPLDLNAINTSICNALQNVTPDTILVCIFPHTSSSTPSSSLSSSLPSQSSSSPSSSSSSSVSSSISSSTSSAPYSSVTSYALIPLSSPSSFLPATSPSLVASSLSLSSFFPSSFPSSSFSSSLPPSFFSSSSSSSSFPSSHFSFSFPRPSSFPSFTESYPSFASSPSAPLPLSSASPSSVFSNKTVFSSSSLPAIASSSSLSCPVVFSSSSSFPVGVSSTSLSTHSLTSTTPTHVNPPQWRALSKQSRHVNMCMSTSEFINPAEYLRRLCKNLECLGFRPPFPSREHFCCSRCKHRKGNVCKTNAETRLRMSKVCIRREFEAWVREGKRKPGEVEARRQEMSALIGADGR